LRLVRKMRFLLAAYVAASAIEATDKDFKELIKNGKNSFVKFLAPW